jgi:hypothetical protein
MYPKKLLALALATWMTTQSVAFAEEARQRESDDQTVSEERTTDRRRLIAVLVGAGAGVGLGLLTALKAMPDTTCRDAKVWAVGAAFGVGGGFGAYALTTPRNTSAKVEPAAAEGDALGTWQPVFSFSDAAKDAARAAGPKQEGGAATATPKDIPPKD